MQKCEKPDKLGKRVRFADGSTPADRVHKQRLNDLERALWSAKKRGYRTTQGTAARAAPPPSAPPPSAAALGGAPVARRRRVPALPAGPLIIDHARVHRVCVCVCLCVCVCVCCVWE